MAASLHSALQSLGPASFDEVPSSPADQRTYIQNLLTQSHHIIESVPQPPATPTADSKSRPRATSASEISSSSARAVPPSRSHEYQALQKEWGKQVNKTNSSASKKEKAQNPLDIPVYKLNGKDGKGAWFARRSVHEGLGFEKWKRRLEEEFGETLRIREEKEQANGVANPGEGTIRGIGGENRVESIAVPETDTGVGGSTTEPEYGGNGVLGKVEVYQLSAQFPGPTAPRDFVTLLITSDMMLDGAGSAENNVEKNSSSPRSYMIISKPCNHPDTQPRDGFIRGQYESVEFIREVPVDRNKNKTRFLNKSESDIPSHAPSGEGKLVTGRKRGKTVPDPEPSRGRESLEAEKRGSGFQEDREIIGNEYDEEDMNPVEWIMITRSDPGGTVPRWMVERGTPGSIVGDAVKFLDWACRDEKDRDEGRNYNRAQDGQPVVEHGEVSMGESAKGDYRSLDYGKMEGNKGAATEPDLGEENQKNSSNEEEYDPAQSNGLMASVTDMVSSYAPQAVRQYLPGQPSQLEESGSIVSGDNSENQAWEIDDGTSISSARSFASAASHADVPALKELAASRQRASSNPSLPVASDLVNPQSRQDSSSATTAHTSRVHIPQPVKPVSTSQERELAKLASRKQEAEAKLATTRAAYESISSKPDTSSQTNKEAQSETATSDRPESNRTGSSNKVEQQQQRKRAATLNRTESKLVSQIDKLGSQQVKLNSKIQERQRKQTAREEREKGKFEIESLKREVETLKNELKDLREERAGWVDLVGRLQKENTKLVAESGGRGAGSERSSPRTAASRSASSG